MDDVLARIAVVAAIGLVALAIARATRRFQQPVHPLVDLRGTRLPGGVVLFTSTDCENCAAARARLKDAGVDFREVTWELEAPILDSVGVEAVPLTVFTDETGRTVDQIAGVPGSRALRRALAARHR